MSEKKTPTLDMHYLMNLREFIANHNYYLRCDWKTQNERRQDLILASFSFHFHNNKFYNELCAEKGITPDSVKQEGIHTIPLIPTSLFKKDNHDFVLTMPSEAIELEIQSTGTSGRSSVTWRDSATVDNLALLLSSLYREYFGISKGFGMFLCPSPAELPEMGMVQALNFLSGMLDDRHYLVNRYRFSTRKAVEILREWEGRQDRYIVGPPFMIHRLLKYLANKEIVLQLEANSKVIMLGGWKKFSGEQISRENFNNLCSEFLGIKSNQVRDMYGLIESNILAIECEAGFKHLPLWVQVFIRDEKDEQRLADRRDQSGIITILDPTCLSYPSFILTEDVGRVEDVSPCKCGRSSQVLSFSRRKKGSEFNTCAVTLERYIDGANKQEEKIL